MKRVLLSSTLVLTAALVAAAPAMAHDAGHGLLGELDDKIITNANFLVIAFFPLFIFAMSLLQWRLEKRKDRRKAAAKSRMTRPEWRGGW
jgi:hypothetical protein